MNILSQNTYVQEILSQADSVKAALHSFDATSLKTLTQAIHRGDFDRVVLTGMGASLFAAYPIWLQLLNAGFPAYWIDCAELIHHAKPLITKRTLIWITSQSGRSAEVLTALELVQQSGAKLLASVNDLDSPLAKAAQHTLPIMVDVEHTVATRTYVNTLAVSQLAATVLMQGDFQRGLAELEFTANGLAEYLKEWGSQLQAIQARVRPTPSLVLLGRGSSLAATYTGALILAEAAKVLATGRQAGEFRHGPLELVSEKLTVLIFAGSREIRELNWRLFLELEAGGAQPIWINSPAEAYVDRQLTMPPAVGLGLSLAEILPIQLLTMHLALQQGVEPGKFFRTGKVMSAE